MKRVLEVVALVVLGGVLFLAGFFQSGVGWFVIALVACFVKVAGLSGWWLPVIIFAICIILSAILVVKNRSYFSRSRVT